MGALTITDLILANSPSAYLSYLLKIYVLIDKLNTESPKNSSLSLSLIFRSEFSFAKDLCVRARLSSFLLLNLVFNLFSNSFNFFSVKKSLINQGYNNSMYYTPYIIY